MRLKNHTDTEVCVEFNGKSVPTDEVHVAEATVLAANAIAGHGKSISNIPFTLIVKKNGVPDLIMVDLPGITNVLVHGQPEYILDKFQVDKTGERTLAVVTKIDKDPEDLLEKVLQIM